MSVWIADDGQLLRRAFGASLGLHLLIALLVPTWLAVQSPGMEPVETISFAHVMRAHIVRPLPAAPPVAIPQTAHRAKAVSFAHHKTEITAKTHNVQRIASAASTTAGSGKTTAPRHVASQSSPLFARAPASNVPLSHEQARAVQTPLPQASADDRVVSSNGAADNGGLMPFGANYQEPVLDPRIKQQLQQIAGVHVTLTVAVNEDGKTEGVKFAPPLDAALEQQIVALLKDATWDPAVCGGGVSCAGKATIVL